MKEGDKAPKPGPRSHRTGLLQQAADWYIRADVGDRLVFPTAVAITRLRPDIVITSTNTKTVILVELTVPWEDRLEESHEIKRNKYEDLLNEARQNGWKAHHFPVEVGCRGFPSRSMRFMLKSLGMPPAKCKTACKRIGEEAERCSRWLWLRHKDKWLFQ